MINFDDEDQEDLDLDKGGSASNGLVEFIEAYRNKPEIWNLKHKDYYKKNIKSKCYEKLLPLLRMFKPAAQNENDVKKQINSLRVNFRKELKKIENSKRWGCGVDDIYEPTSRIFYDLMFLKDLEVPKKGLSTMKSRSPIDETNDLSTQNEQDEDENINVTCAEVAKQTIPSKKRKYDQQDLLKQACNYFSRSENTDTDYLAKSWAIKLKSVTKLQRIFAEKAINEVLLEAELGNLTKNSVKINENEYSRTSTPLTPTLETNSLSEYYETLQ